MMRHIGRALILLLLSLSLSGCAVRLLYNWLDWAIEWKLDDYFSLTRQQSQVLDAQITPLLQWHRREALPQYVRALRSLSFDLRRPLTEAEVARYMDIFEQLMQQLAEPAKFLRGKLPGLTELGLMYRELGRIDALVEDILLASLDTCVLEGEASLPRDGAGLVEVGIHLQKMLQNLACLGDVRYRKAAARQSEQALARAQATLTLTDDIVRIEQAAARVAKEAG